MSRAQCRASNNLFLVADGFDEIGYIQLRSRQERFNSRQLGLVITPTMGCNFACHYCFESKTMRTSVVSKTPNQEPMPKPKRSWDLYFHKIAEAVAEHSRDTTPVGAVLVRQEAKIIVATGYNGAALPHSEQTTSVRPGKLQPRTAAAVCADRR